MKALLRRLAALLGGGDQPLEPGISGTHAENTERVFQLRNRILCGYY
jgi:hypothetical protein